MPAQKEVIMFLVKEVIGRNIKHIIILAILISLQNFVSAQVSKERKAIIGIWMAEDKNWGFEFKPGGKCIEFIRSSKTFETLTYKISDTMPLCIPAEPPIESKEDDITFLEMTNRKTGLKLCYEINGVTAKILSLRPLGRGGFLLFNRVRSY